MRLSTRPIPHQRTIRKDRCATMSSGKAGKVVPAGYFPLLPGDACAGTFGIDVELAEMPKPLLNGVGMNVQAWFVPKVCDPRFAGFDEAMASYTGHTNTYMSSGTSQSDPKPTFYRKVTTALERTQIREGEIYQTLGIYPAFREMNTDLIDAYALIHNFRLKAHSDNLTRRQYFDEFSSTANILAPAFWPSGAWSNVVPDYDVSLRIGEMDLDVQSGRFPLSNLGFQTDALGTGSVSFKDGTGEDGTTRTGTGSATDVGDLAILTKLNSLSQQIPDVYTDLAQDFIALNSSLAAVDKARELKSFAKIREQMAGIDSSGFINENAILAMMMSGLKVPQDQFQRPILLDSKRVMFGFAERFATDSANLTDSVTQGRASATLSINVPEAVLGGTVMFIIEVLPERIDERASDEWLHVQDPADLPEPVRDSLRIDPTDLVLNRRLDSAHTNGGGLYGYEPMNNVWNRDFTRMGGIFQQIDPETEVTESRAGIWQANIIDPSFDETHWLAPQPFPNDVFADTLKPSFEFVARHDVRVSGLTQMGNPLMENVNAHDDVRLHRQSLT